MEPNTQQAENPAAFNPDRPISAVLKQEEQGFVATPQTENTIPQTASQHSPRILKTLESDSAIGIQEQNESRARMVIAEQRRKDKEAELQEELVPKKEKIAFIVISSLLVVFGILAVGITYYALTQRTAPVAVVDTSKILPSDNQGIIDISKKSLKETIASINQELQISHEPNTIRTLLLQYTAPDNSNKMVTSSVTISEFTKYFLPHMPDDLARAFDGMYILGSTGGTTTIPFVILTTSSYGQAFGGLLTYEPNMLNDFQPIFNISISSANTPSFTDSIFQNRDMRTLFDDTNTPILIYGFLDNKTVIVTTSTDALQQIYNRFLAGQFK